MCGAARYYPPDRPGKAIGIGYGYPKAAMPVIRPSGVEWVPWGRRKGQDEAAPLPTTGWARLETIEKGGWDKYRPEFVLLAVQEFGERDAENQRHWFPVSQGKAIQALIAHSDNVSRLYVVTVPTPPEYAWVHDKWPRQVEVPT